MNLKSLRFDGEILFSLAISGVNIFHSSNYVFYQPAGHSLIAGEKIIFFVEFFIAVITNVPSFFIVI